VMAEATVEAAEAEGGRKYKKGILNVEGYCERQES